MRDLFAALIDLCQAESTITDLAEDRIFVNEIPREVVEAEDPRAPKKTLVIRQGGGGGKADVLPLADRTIIALAYGETDYDAAELLRAVTERFTYLSREIWTDVLIHHINPTGGPIPSVEPDLVWPAIAQSFTTKADIMEAP